MCRYRNFLWSNVDSSSIRSTWFLRDIKEAEWFSVFMCNSTHCGFVQVLITQKEGLTKFSFLWLTTLTVPSHTVMQEKVKFQSDNYVVEAVLIILMCYLLSFRPNALSMMASMQ